MAKKAKTVEVAAESLIVRTARLIDMLKDLHKVTDDTYISNVNLKGLEIEPAELQGIDKVAENIEAIDYLIRQLSDKIIGLKGVVG